MASPTVIVYQSTDVGAPAYTTADPQPETTGFINVLDKCLVTGYGTKAAAGWTKPYTGTNKTAFRPNAGNRLYLRVDDDNAGAGYQTLDLNGYETMTDVDTGTGLFPSAAITPKYQFRAASYPATRPWKIIADDRTVYVLTDADNNLLYGGFMFGDFYSYVSSDAYRTGLFGGTAAGNGGISLLGDLQTTLGASLDASVVARDYTGTGAALKVGRHGDLIKEGTTELLGLIPYPNAADNKLWLSPVYIHETAGPTIRGKMRGFWQWLHPIGGIADGDTFPGTGALAGRVFAVIKSESTGRGVFIIETSSTWDTN